MTRIEIHSNGPGRRQSFDRLEHTDMAGVCSIPNISSQQPLSRGSLRDVPNNQDRYKTCDDQCSGQSSNDDHAAPARRELAQNNIMLTLKVSMCANQERGNTDG